MVPQWVLMILQLNDVSYGLIEAPSFVV